MRDLDGSLREQATGQTVEYLGRRMCKTRDDVLRYRDLLKAERPAFLIETGTWTGVSAAYFAAFVPLVVTIDTQEVQDPPKPERGEVLYLTGSSTDPAVKDEAAELVGPIMRAGGRGVVVLDSDHSAGHVLAELVTWAPYAYRWLIVEDTITAYMDPRGAGYDGSPLDAVGAFLEQCPRWQVDEDIEDRYPTTQHPGGWLCRR